MKVTKISPQQKNADRVSIFVDNEYRFSLFINQLLDEKLKVGTELSDSDIDRFIKLSQEGKLRMRTMEWLMLRPRSTKELRDYLRRKQCDPEQITQIVTDMQRLGYQNNDTFAVWWAAQRRRQQKSAHYIAQELKTKGISGETISTALAQTDTNDNSVLVELIVKKRRITRYQDDKKLIEYLMRQGYRYADINAAINALSQDN